MEFVVVIGVAKATILPPLIAAFIDKSNRKARLPEDEILLKACREKIEDKKRVKLAREIIFTRGVTQLNELN